MKKILISLFVFLCFPVFCLASNYDISNYYIDATLKENGDMDVSELIVLDGTLENGYERDILYLGSNNLYSASNISNISVSGGYISDVSFDSFLSNYDNFISVNNANNGDSAKYILSNIYNGIRIRMYYSTKSEKTAFLIKYTLSDVGILHNDVIEFYWNFLGNDFSDKINDLNIRVNYPSLMNLEDFSWWFHGPLTGNSNIINTGTYTSVLGTVSKVSEYQAVDFRTIVPKNGFDVSSFKKVSDDEVKESIVAAEDEIVAKDLENIKRNRIIYYTFIGLSISYYIVLLIIWIYVYKKYDKERKPKFNLEYNREFIDDYNVEVVDYLMNNAVTPNAMSASIMNLIYKKNIKAEKIENEKNSYKFILLNRDNLNDTENLLVDFLFLKVGENNEFSTKDLKKYASSTKTCNTFMNSYTSWKQSVINDGKKQGFYDKLNDRFKYGFLMLILSFLIMFVGTFIFHVESLLLSSLFFVGIIFFVYVCVIRRKSEKGIEDYTKWMAFKRFLKDFGTFNIKELPEIVLWERYLVYATVFGLAKKVESAMNVKIKELDINDLYSDYVFVNCVDLSSCINNSITQAYQGAQNAISRDSINASGGSFGGHGGGFSSGGGFGGGGGGGRGF